MKTRWQSFLDTIHFATEKTTKQRTMTLFGIVVWAVLAVIAPYLINDTYKQALVSSVIGLFMLITLLLYVKKQWTYNEAKWSYNYSGILCNIGIIVLTLNILYLLFPVIRLTPQPMGQMQDETVYAVYSPDCPYCAAANSNLNKAVTAYNATHANNVRVINMSKPAPVIEDVLEHVDRVGIVVYVDNEGTSHTDFYTLGRDGEPIEPPVEYIYQKFKQYTE